MKKFLRTLGLFVLLAIGGIAIVIMIAGRDIPPPDTSDLIPEKIELAPEQNAYTYFVSATNQLYWPTNDSVVYDYLDGKLVDEGMIQEILSRNTNMLDTIERGLARKRCCTPEIIGFGALLPMSYLSSWRKTGRVMALKSRHERLTGNHADATDTCISLLQFSNMIQSDAESLVNYLMGVAILRFGLMQAQDLAYDKDTHAEDLRRLSKALTALGPFDRGLIRATKVEYRCDAKIIDQLQDGKLSMNDPYAFGGEKTMPVSKYRRIQVFLLQPNKTKLAFANFYRNTIKNTSLPYADMNHCDVKEALHLEITCNKRIPQLNATGKWMFYTLIPAVSRVLDRKCEDECVVAATRILVACNAYRKEEGKLPADLQALVPKYLPAIPTDPYDGKPFRYVPAKAIVYSVGKDLKDSGGSSKVPEVNKADSPAKRLWEAEDVVFGINGRIE